MSARRRGAGAVVVAALAGAATVAASGCSIGQLQFRNDHRLAFTAPGSRAEVDVPLTVSWTIEDFAPTGLDGSRTATSGVFVVFVDRAPMPVGKDLRWLARDAGACAPDAPCPDPQYLADRGIYVTTDTTLTVPSLPARGADTQGEHSVIVVLADGTGTRIGESAWHRAFRTDEADDARKAADR